MPPLNQPGFDDRLVVEYLLGIALDEDSERFDRLSIDDDEFAARLRAVEHDLVDAYVRRELAPEILTRFESVYFCSEIRKAKVEFAKSLLVLADQGLPRPVSAPLPTDASSRPVRRWLPSWAFAAAACAMLLVSGYLFYQPYSLRRQVERRQADNAALEQSRQELRRQLGERRRSDAATPPDLKTTVPFRVRDVLAFALPPQTRGGASPTAILVPPGTHRALFYLQLESDDFAGYRAALRDLATNQIIWRSGTLTARPSGKYGTSVAVSFSSTLLKQHNYTLELTGIGPAGAGEFAGSYAFRVTGG